MMMMMNGVGEGGFVGVGVEWLDWIGLDWVELDGMGYASAR